jgi:cation diffusion facilitator family transporter
MNSLSHSHDYSSKTQDVSEKRTFYVVLLTASMMFIEIFAGWYYNSIALLADGWHMSTHALALGVSVYAYRYARLNKNNTSYSFGTGKINALGSFASAVILALVAIFIFVEAFSGLLQIRVIRYNEAIAVAIVGLFVNALSIWLLKTPHSHDHGHSHEHEDHNLSAAYAHVVADTLTSVLAIVALLTAKYLTWNWADSLAGIVGAIIVGQWAFNLLKSTTPILLDKMPETGEDLKVKALLEPLKTTTLNDIHLWKLAPNATACMISLTTSNKDHTPDFYKNLLAPLNFNHLTLEVNYE